MQARDVMHHRHAAVQPNLPAHCFTAVIVMTPADIHNKFVVRLYHQGYVNL